MLTQEAYLAVLGGVIPTQFIDQRVETYKHGNFEDIYQRLYLFRHKAGTPVVVWKRHYLGHY